MAINIQILTNQMMMFATLIVIGLVAQRIKLLSEADIKNFSALLSNFIIPCFMITTMPNGGTREDIAKCGLFALAAAAYIFCMFLISFGVSFLLGFQSKARRRMHVLISSAGNGGFLGAPLALSVFPELSIPIAFYVIFEAFVLWLFGPVIADPETKFNKENLKNMLSPITISIIAGFVLTMIGIHPKGFIPWDAISDIGSTIKYFASFYMGLHLGVVGFRKVFSDVRILIASLFKLIIFPLTMYAIVIRLHIFEPNILGLLLLMGSTPTAMVIPMIAAISHSDVEYATAGTLVNTILFLVTIPFVVYMANFIG